MRHPKVEMRLVSSRHRKSAHVARVQTKQAADEQVPGRGPDGTVSRGAISTAFSRQSIPRKATPVPGEP